MPNVIVSPTGVQGPRGNTILNGAGTPGAATGIDGDYYIDTTNYPGSVVLYGPKAGGAWPGSGVTLTGAAGALLAVNNLSDLTNPATARTNLGLGTAATQPSGAFDAAGAAAAAQAAAIAAIPGAASTVTAETTYGQASAAGTASAYSRGDHTHGTPTLPAASSGTAGVVQLAGDLGGSSASPQVTGTHLASPLPAVQGGTGTASAAAALALYASVQGRNPVTGRWHPEAYGAVGDYTTDDTTAVNACIDACSAAGGGTVRLLQHAVSGAGLHVRSNVTLEGIPGYSKLKQLTSNFVIASDGTAASNVAFRDFIIEGPVNEVPTVPKRTRTTSGAGTTMGIWITGDLDPTATNPPVIDTVTIERVTIRNCTSLPIRISGVRGTVLTKDCLFYNNQDAGWIFCENVRAIGNRSKWSADNGLSLSRGNLSVVCTGNSVEGAAYHGIWLSGYVGYTGPQDFTCTGNTVKNVGQTGILLQDAPLNGNVTGNTIDKNYVRGDSTAPTDDYVYGILVRGSSATPSAPGTSIAYGLKIDANTILHACKAAIGIDGATGVAITNNLLVDCGTQFLADGTTAIAASDTTQNVGVHFRYPTTVTACIVRGNDIIDSRTTPYTNWGIYPTQVSGVLTVGNTMQGCRNTSNLPAVLDAWNDTRLTGAQESIPRWAASGTVSMNTGIMRLAYFTARRNATVTAIRIPSSTSGAWSGTTPTLIRFALFSADSSGNLTLLSATTSDTTVFSANGTSYTRNLGASQSLIAGQTYALGCLVVTTGTTASVPGGNFAVGGENILTPYLCANVTGLSDIPSSVTFASLSQTASAIYATAVGA